MTSSATCFTPLVKQFVVTAGVALSLMEHSLVMGFTTILLSQLRDDPIIIIDENSASWIASIVGLASLLGSITGHSLIERCGRRNSNLISAVIFTFGWFFIYLSSSVHMIMFARFIQGFGTGISSMTGTILVGEYTTPRYRGAFLTMTVGGLVTGGLIVHTIGSFLSWYSTALFCLCIAIANLILIVLSPESPLYLASCGKYDKCTEVFHWLRGFNEDDELKKMITTAMANNAAKQQLNNTETSLKKLTLKTSIPWLTLGKTEFYKPLLIMLHLFLCTAWCGHVILDVYAIDIYHILIGKNVNTFIMLSSMDIFGIISTFSAIALIKKFNRRPLFIFLFSLNIFVLFLTAVYAAVYSYIKENTLSFDHPAIGGSLICLLTMSARAGPVCSSLIISGEIFPLKYKSVCTLISILFLNLNVAIAMKTQPYMFSSLGTHGSFFVYGVICVFGSIVALLMLPETKDLTLQDIEEEYWINPIKQEYSIKPESDFNSRKRDTMELKKEELKKLMAEFYCTGI